MDSTGSGRWENGASGASRWKDHLKSFYSEENEISAQVFRKLKGENEKIMHAGLSGKFITQPFMSGLYSNLKYSNQQSKLHFQ
jgi:hypothetical protein